LVDFAEDDDAGELGLGIVGNGGMEDEDAYLIVSLGDSGGRGVSYAYHHRVASAHPCVTLESAFF
jgi:hypothetical protein